MDEVDLKEQTITFHLPSFSENTPSLEAGPSALGLAAMAPPELDTFAQEAGLYTSLGAEWVGAGFPEHTTV